MMVFIKIYFDDYFYFYFPVYYYYFLFDFSSLFFVCLRALVLFEGPRGMIM